MKHPVSLQRSIRWTMSSVALLAILLQLGGATWLDVHDTRSEMSTLQKRHLQRHKERLRAQVEGAVFYLNHTLPGAVPAALGRKRQDAALDYLQEIRFGNGDILFAVDLSDRKQPVSLLGAYPRYKKLADIPEPEAVRQAARMRALAETGGGFLQYQFNDGQGVHPNLKKRLKVSYIAPLTEAGWLIGGGVYLPDIAPELQRLQSEAWERLLWRLAYAIGFLLVAVVVIRAIFNRVATRLDGALADFSQFFERASQQGADIEKAQVALVELEPLAEAAHRMVRRRREIEAQLHHSQKMDAVGQLAGGIAHDFNNLLTAILGSGQSLMEQLEPEDSCHEDASIICEAAERAALLTRQMLAFSRQARVQSVQVDLHEMIRETTHLFGRSVDLRIVLSLNLEAEIPLVVGDCAQLENALLNLCVNARDALGEGLETSGSGRIEISTSSVQVVKSSTLAEEVLLEPGKYVELRVCDDGCGMSDSVRSRIFEPFYTTKAPGVGTGLGLSGTYGCIREHGGRISVETKVGVGTKFRILLPICVLDNAKPHVERSESSPVGTGIILLVDDHTAVRNLTMRQLQRLGYTVVACEDGAVGLAEFRKLHSSLVLVVLDLMMPIISGEEMFRGIEEIAPEVPVLLCSGYGKNDVAQRLISLGAKGLLVKPFREEELARAVAAALRELPTAEETQS